MYYKATHKFTKFPFLKKSEFAQIHSERLEEHTVFNNPDYTPQQVSDAAEDLSKAHTAYYKNSGDDEHNLLLAANERLDVILKANADYITKVANGDKILIESAGMIPTKDKAQVVKLPHDAKGGNNAGTIEAYYTKGKEYVTVVWKCIKKQDTPLPADDIVIRSTSLDKIEIKGLESAYYYVYAAPVKRKSDGRLTFELVKLVFVT